MDRFNKPLSADLWNIAHGGIRGSTSLIAGAMALAGASALGLVAETAAALSGGGAVALVATARLAWIVVLGVIGWGLIGVGVGPVMSRLGIVVGSAYFCEAVIQLVSAVSFAQPLVTLTAVTAGRLLLVAAFAVAEHATLGADPARRMARVAVGHAAAVCLMAVVLPSATRPVVDQFLDTLFGVALALPLWQAGLNVREAEAAWAIAHLEEFEDTGLEVFNNPDHEHLVQR